MYNYAMIFSLILFTISCSNTQTKADSIYYNGDIITLNDDQPNVEAIAISKGKILALGDLTQLYTYTNHHTKMINLHGQTLLPGFIDAHGHTFGVGMQSVSANLYPKPDGVVEDISDMLDVMKAYYETDPALYKEIKWVVGFGYDDSNLKELRHPTKHDLDKIFPDIPAYVIRQSGHIGVANSKALELVNITSSTTNPIGGVIVREPNSNEPNGVLEEMAHLEVFYKIGQFSPMFAAKLFLSGVNTMMSYGFTTAQEGRAGSPQLFILKILNFFRQLPIDIVAFADIEKASDWFSVATTQHQGRFRVGGLKLTLDGSPQGKTAWRDRAYVVPPHGQHSDYKGYPAIEKQIAMEKIITAIGNNQNINVHANGEAAIDLFLEAVGKAREQYPTNDTRPVLVHGQFMRRDHVDKIKELKVFPSVFPLHTFYWGDWHSEQTIGKPGVYHISPTKWLEDNDILFTTHHDAPIVVPNSMMMLWAAVNRLSRSHQVIGANQRISTLTALKSTSKWAAYQLFEEDIKGTLEVGKFADFVILSQNPLSTDSLQLTNIQIIETIKEGKSVYKNAI